VSVTDSDLSVFDSGHGVVELRVLLFVLCAWRTSQKLIVTRNESEGIGVAMFELSLQVGSFIDLPPQIPSLTHRVTINTEF
jgi:hypothetical protein